jgi:predicted transposase YdaD
MVIFYAIGIYARYTLTEIYEQVKKKKAKIMHAEETKETKEIKEAKHEVKQTGETGNSIAEEEFEPLKVSRFIREKLEQPVEK